MLPRRLPSLALCPAGCPGRWPGGVVTQMLRASSMMFAGCTRGRTLVGVAALEVLLVHAAQEAAQPGLSVQGGVQEVALALQAQGGCRDGVHLLVEGLLVGALLAHRAVHPLLQLYRQLRQEGVSQASACCTPGIHSHLESTGG